MKEHGLLFTKQDKKDLDFVLKFMMQTLQAETRDATELSDLPGEYAEMIVRLAMAGDSMADAMRRAYPEDAEAWDRVQQACQRILGSERFEVYPSIFGCEVPAPGKHRRAAETVELREEGPAGGIL